MSKLNGQYCAVLFGGYDISGRSRQFDCSIEFEPEDATAFQDGCENSQAGLPKSESNVVSFVDPVETDGYVGQSMKALKTPGSDKVLIFMFGEGAVPDEGNEAFASLVKQFNYNLPLSPHGKVIGNAKFSCAAYAPGLGEVMDYATITNTKTGDTVDGGAAHSDGGALFLVVFLGASEDTPGTDTYSIQVQHNTADNGSWIDYLTLTLDGSVRGSERKSSASTLQRYRRLLMTRTGTAGDSVGIAAVLCEN